ncbi:hypothetical protein PGT21_024516 [Puccinia graminis f. sp. tritici]|nr:hypothetical protein PGT21_024516 [Puccinia graminis f. sp. tritici]
MISHSSGRDYFLVSLLSPNISDEGTHAHPTNWTVLIIARHISNPETLNWTWILVGIIALICILLAAICPIILAYCDYFGGGRDDEENMVVDLITPFRHQDYPSEIQKEDTDFRSLGPGRATKADMSKPLKLNRGPTAGEFKNTKNKENCFAEIDHDGDGISLNDFKICQARKMINLQPFRPSGHQYNDKNSSDSLGSPTATSTSSFTANSPVSPLTTITSPKSFQSLAFSDYHSPLPSLPKKCVTT